MNRWELTAHDKETGELMCSLEGKLMSDDFEKIAPAGLTHAEVELDLTWTAPMGSQWLKLRAAVRVWCQQDETSIDRAGELALSKITEFVSVGSGLVSNAFTKGGK